MNLVQSFATTNPATHECAICESALWLEVLDADQDESFRSVVYAVESDVATRCADCDEYACKLDCSIVMARNGKRDPLCLFCAQFHGAHHKIPVDPISVSGSTQWTIKALLQQTMGADGERATRDMRQLGTIARTSLCREIRIHLENERAAVAARRASFKVVA